MIVKKTITPLLSLVIPVTLLLLNIQPASFGQTGRATVKFDSIHITCLNLIRAERHYVINTEEAYQELLQHRVPGESCYGYQLPKIDFSAKTLIGVLISSEGCKPPNLINSITAEGNEYLVSVKIRRIGVCRQKYLIMSWFVIDKLKEATKVTFETKSHP